MDLLRSFINSGKAIANKWHDITNVWNKNLYYSPAAYKEKKPIDFPHTANCLFIRESNGAVTISSQSTYSYAIGFNCASMAALSGRGALSTPATMHGNVEHVMSGTREDALAWLDEKFAQPGFASSDQVKSFERWKNLLELAAAEPVIYPSFWPY